MALLPLRRKSCYGFLSPCYNSECVNGIHISGKVRGPFLVMIEMNEPHSSTTNANIRSALSQQTNVRVHVKLLTRLDIFIHEHLGLRIASIGWTLKQLNTDHKNLLIVMCRPYPQQDQEDRYDFTERLFSDVTWTHTTPAKTGQCHNNGSTQLTVFWYTTGASNVNICQWELLSLKNISPSLLQK
jgi:hypothetical protein